jgi:hypothetical protein
MEPSIDPSVQTGLTSAVPLPEEGRHNVNVRHPIIKISKLRLRGADITLENPMLRRNQNAHKALD